MIFADRSYAALYWISAWNVPFHGNRLIIATVLLHQVIGRNVFSSEVCRFGVHDGVAAQVAKFCFSPGEAKSHGTAKENFTRTCTRLLQRYSNALLWHENVAYQAALLP
jgi:hypothetical protein